MFAWITALTPLIGEAIYYPIVAYLGPFVRKGPVSYSSHWYISVVLYLLSAFVDYYTLIRAGKKHPALIWVLVPPVYLWKRSTILRKPRTMFWAFLLSWVASVLIGVAFWARITAH